MKTRNTKQFKIKKELNQFCSTLLTRGQDNELEEEDSFVKKLLGLKQSLLDDNLSETVRHGLRGSRSRELYKLIRNQIPLGDISMDLRRIQFTFLACLKHRKE